MEIMIDAKQKISDWTKIEKERLNDISLGDIELSEYARENIGFATLQMLENDLRDIDWETLEALLTKHLGCKTYWVEHTRELILIIWNACQAKTIVIPEEGWMLRNDITIH
jgi:hypothetical protein